MTDPTQEERSEADTAETKSLAKNVSAKTKTLPDVPSVRNEEAWTQEASPAQAADAVSAVEAMTPANMSEDDVGELAQMVARRDYSEGELAYAVEQMMYDDQLTKELTSFRERPVLYPSDFDRFISEHREMRRRIEQLLDRHEMNRLINDFPKHLSRSDFGIAGYTVKDKPLFRFKQNPETGDGEVRPTIDENARPGQDRVHDEDGSDPVKVEEALPEVDTEE